MEIKEKAYFEIYQDDKLITQGIGENLKFSGNLIKVEFLPKSYTYTTHWGNTIELPSYIIKYCSNNEELFLGLLTKKEFNNIMNTFNKYDKDNSCEKL